MDTKWKNIRNVLSFIIFSLGVSLTLWNGVDLLHRLPRDVSSWTPEKLLEEDYQQSGNFRSHISGLLESFLTIAVNGYPGGWYYGDSFYPGSYYYDYYYNDYYNYYNEPLIEETLILEREKIAQLRQMTDYGQTAEAYAEYGDDWDDDEDDYQDGSQKRAPLTDEQKKKLSEQYFSNIEGDKNLLYSISYDGELLYSNAGPLTADGGVQAPEGYNFLLYFDGERVHITKDGQELDVYGDGYYRDEKNDWYVPGYRNFPVNEEIKKAVVCMAVAKEPVLYTQGPGKKGGYRQQSNTLYWLQYHYSANRKLLLHGVNGFAAGLILLLLSLFCRRGKREAAKGIARLQGRLWVECKAFLLFLLLWASLGDYFTTGYGYTLWNEFRYYIPIQAAEIGQFGTLLLSSLSSLPSLFWTALFWVIWLTANDIRHNGNVWRSGLILKLYQTFTARELKQPLARRMACRNAILFGAAIAYGILTIPGVVILFDRIQRYKSVWGISLFLVLETLGFLLAEYLIGARNMIAARDVDALSERINDIYSGNYSDTCHDSHGGAQAERSGPVSGCGSDTAAEYSGSASGCGSNTAAECRTRTSGTRFTGHDLGDTMAQLEDIRQGMAVAVDEQMKSERTKVELIANVSHDIKTPLTSIISYVQFLKEEEGLPEHVQDYVRILDEKSQRLKNMVQDVFAVSKAASGELPIHMEELDFCKLLRQTMADMDEEIRNSRVSFRTELPEEPVMITADGQRMYRVFQNLFQNALRYSLDGSRVYVTLRTDGTMAVASVKNTSHMELERDKNFTERFVRGDMSRTDGGSGLGLSIAQSFTEACGGQFALEFNADLFIVKVSFRVLEAAG